MLSENQKENDHEQSSPYYYTNGLHSFTCNKFSSLKQEKNCKQKTAHLITSFSRKKMNKIIDLIKR